MVNVRLSYFEVFNLNFNIFNVLSQFSLKNKDALPENIVLIYSIFFLIRNSSFQENAKTKVQALEDMQIMNAQRHIAISVAL